MLKGERKASDGRFSIGKQVKEGGSPCPHSAHIGRQSRPNLRDFKRKNAVSGDVKKSSLPGRFFSLRVGFAVCIPLFRKKPNDFKSIWVSAVWVMAIFEVYCTNEK